MRNIHIREDINRCDLLMLRICFHGKPVSRPDRLSLEVLDIPDHCVYQFQEGTDQLAVIGLRVFILDQHEKNV